MQGGQEAAGTQNPGAPHRQEQISLDLVAPSHTVDEPPLLLNCDSLQCTLLSRTPETPDCIHRGGQEAAGTQEPHRNKGKSH